MSIRNFGRGTTRFNEGIIVSGSSGATYAIHASGSVEAEELFLDKALEPAVNFSIDGNPRAKISVNSSNNLVLHNQFTNKHIVFKVNDQGVTREGIRLNGAIPEVVINEQHGVGGDNSLIDFRVESENNTHMLYVSGGSDRVGIGTDSPSAQLHISNNSTDDLFFLETTEDSNSASPIIKLKRNSSSPADADYLGQFKFQGENSADQSVTYAKISGKIGSVIDGQEQGIIEFANVKNGSNTITARFKSDELQLLNGTNLSVDGEIEVSQYIRHVGDPNTHINFSDDKIILKAGNKAMITMEEKDAAPHEVTINDGGNNIDLVVEDSSGDTLLMTDADISSVLVGAGSTNSADANFFVSGSTRSRGTTTRGTALFGGDLVVSGTLTAIQKHICTAKYTMDSADKQFIRFNAAGSNSTAGVNNKFVAPVQGILSFIMIRSTGTPGQTAIGFHRSTDGTADLGSTPVETQNIVMNNADTTYKIMFTQAANFGPGDIVGLSVDPAANHGNVDITLVFELDFVS